MDIDLYNNFANAFIGCANCGSCGLNNIYISNEHKYHFSNDGNISPCSKIFVIAVFKTFGKKKAKKVETFLKTYMGGYMPNCSHRNSSQKELLMKIIKSNDDLLDLE